MFACRYPTAHESAMLDVLDVSMATFSVILKVLNYISQYGQKYIYPISFS